MKRHSKRLISFLLMISMLMGVFSSLFVFAEGEVATDEAPVITETTDDKGAVITTEKGETYTKITYSMTLGTAGTSGNYIFKYTAADASVYTGQAGDSTDNVGIVTKLPLYLADKVTGVTVNVTRPADGVLGIYADLTNPEVLTDRTEAKIYDYAGAGDLSTDISDAVTSLVAGADTTPSHLFVTLGSKSTGEYNAPKVSALSISITYGEAFDIETSTETDDKGATITTEKITTSEPGVGQTRVTYSMTGGSTGTSGNFLASGSNASEGFDGGWAANVVYKFPLLYTEHLIGLVGKITPVSNQPQHFALHAGVTDASTFGDAIFTITGQSANGEPFVYDFASAVNALLVDSSDATDAYIKLARIEGNDNAKKYAAVEMTAVYDTIFTTKTFTDNFGANITTEHLGTTTSINYSMTCGTSGTNGNYYVGAGGQAAAYDGGWQNKNITYRFPLVDRESLTSFVGTFTMENPQFNMYVAIDSASTDTAVDTGVYFGSPIATNGATTYTYDFTGTINALLAESDWPAEYVYIRFDWTTNGNGPRIKTVSIDAEYDTYLDETHVTDDAGASIRTIKKNGTTTKKIYTMTAGTAGTSGNYCIDQGNTGKIGANYYAASYDPVVYKFAIEDGTFIEGIVTLVAGGSFSNATTPRALYLSLADPAGNINNMTLVAVSATADQARKNYSYDITDTLTTLLEANPEATDVYVGFYGTEWNNNPALYSLSATFGYGTSETVEDENGAPITSTLYGDTFSRNYYLTAGTLGTSGDYVVRTSGATDNTYKGGSQDKNTMGCVYRFPIEFATLSDIKFSATTESARGLYVDVSASSAYAETVDSYVKIYDPSPTVWEAKATYEYDIKDKVLELLAAEPDAKYLYLALNSQGDYNAPAVYDVDLTMTYDLVDKDGCDHDFTYETEAIQSTCTETGLKVCSCGVCGAVVQAISEPKGHNLEWTNHDGEQHVGTCTRCGETQYAEHVWNESGITAIGHTVSDTAVNTIVATPAGVVTDAEYQRAVQFNTDTTNISMLQAVMNRAKAGEEITIAALGGSITEGWGASDRATTAYAPLVADWWETTFSNTTVNFVNAGIGGTTSYFGVQRMQAEVIDAGADLCIVDFTVNDRTDAYMLASYESVIANLLANDVAVIALVMMNEGDGLGFIRPHHKAITDKYRVPVISYAEAIKPTFDDGTRAWEAVSDDTIHPNDAGHAYTAELFWRYLNEVYEYCPADVVATKGLADQFLLIPKFNNAALADSDSDLLTVSKHDGFVKNATQTIKNHTNGWYSETGVGEICFTATFDTLGMLYKNARGVRGGFTLYIDGEEIAAHTANNAYFGETEILYESGADAEHEVRVVFDSANGAVTLGGFLLSIEADAGMYAVPCTVCDATKAPVVLKESGHNFDEGVVTVPPTESSTGIKTYTCDCGHTSLEELPEVALSIGSMYLNLTNDINAFYTVYIAENAENVYAVFSFRGNQYTVRDYTIRESDGKYLFKYSGIIPSYMNYKLGITVYATVDGEELVVSSEGMSIREYYEAMVVVYPDETELLTLLSDLLVYGEKAQLYTGFDTNALVTDGLTLTPTETFTKPQSALSVSGTVGTCPADWSGVGLVLDDKMNVYFTFKATDLTDLSVSITINGRTTEYTSDDFIKVSDGKYRVNFVGINAYEFDDIITASFSVGGEQVGRTATYSVNSYISSKYTAEGDTLSDLLAAIHNYGASAKAYKTYTEAN